ncbi:LacI family DNA-binding transcriptional regulator [uncultured Clostridium sp.]|uniref:LacI family DNA-binding transcriptional regulator n=1 Tax=uncultured Clostridium sp. TaxID=59620 RepID=UPI0028F150D2|nr:LacI family DNA-binding transcriptional regulator [uncultured Clostridium sp.]
MKRPTIKDIAKECGISIATVSYVINGKYDKVSEEKIKLVNDTIEEIGYVPSMNAQSLVGKGSKLIGVIIPQLEVTEKMIFTNPFYSEFIAGIEYYLRKHGYSIVLSVLNQDKGYEDMLIKWNLDAAIIFGLDEHIKLTNIKKVSIPIVLIDSYVNDDNYFRLNINDEEASYIATEFLIKEGHKKVALVTGVLSGYGVLHERYLGYKRALKEYNIPFDERLVIQGDITYEHGVKSAADIVNKVEATAAVATADIIAVGLVNGFKMSDKNVPKDYSVIGFDDTYLASIFHPKLTTIHQDISKRGELAGEVIINIINGKQRERNICTKTKLIIRETTK